uniref:Uncharacterized protein n=1 Tax=viral metagenome TaxID=1070528 RepID=A0A6M3XMY0_9ZZZZ
MSKKTNIGLFLDSGAFSAFSKGAKISLEEYVNFIKGHQEYLEVYANLDVLGDPQATLDNQDKMEQEGLFPLPCFHYGEPIEFLEHYLKYNYIALGGMVPIATNDLLLWLDQIFAKYICDDSGMPKVKVHGFGMTSLKLMKRYPWYSVDSTSWVVTSRVGQIMVPQKGPSGFNFILDPWKVAVSSRSPGKEEHDKHYATMGPKAKATIDEYLASIGFEMGESDFYPAAADCSLVEGERWSGKPLDNGERLVEKIISPGVCNDYMQRDQVNIKYFLELEKALPEWPWAFKLKTKGFGI